MKKEKSLIEVVKSIPPVFHAHLDSLNLGKPENSSPVRYRHIETGVEYLHLAAAIAWPGKEAPGYILVIGVRADLESGLLVYECLAEDEDYSIESLLSKYLSLRNCYGFREGEQLLRILYGDRPRFASLVNHFNRQRQKGKYQQQEEIHIVAPIDFEKENRFEIYLRRILSALTPVSTGKKTILLGSCHRLRNTLQNLPPDAAIRFSEDDCPAAFALGSLLHSLMASTPWAWQASAPTRTRSDIDDFEAYALAHRDNRDSYLSEFDQQRQQEYYYDV